MQPRSPVFKAERLDVQAFARAGAELTGSTPIARLQRLSSSAHAGQADAPVGIDSPVQWAARGEWRERVGSAPQVWLHITAETELPMTCQRCLQAVVEPLSVDRWFRFVASEDEAVEQDPDAEEDLLVLQRQFDLQALIEDELLLALPLIPRHEVCPDPLPVPDALPAAAEEVPDKPNPFAALEALKKKPTKGRGH